MPLRAIWKGHIRFSLVTIPIRVYNAVDSGQTVSFNQLHREDNGRIGYDKRCKTCGEIVKNDDIVKGYEYEPDQYVIIESSDLESIRLKSTRVIEIEGFVSAAEVHPTLYDAPYYAGPDGPVAAKTYGLLCQALRESGKLGIGRVVLRDREDVVVIGPHENGMILYKLRYPDALRKMGEVPQLEDVEADAQQLALATHLIDSMTRSLGDIPLQDRYGEAVREMIDAKIAGQEVVTASEEEPKVIDIMDALKKSIEQAQGARKPMKKSEAEPVASPRGSKSGDAEKATKKVKKARKAKVA
jgi:DNA end-binding protein Ku